MANQKVDYVEDEEALFNSLCPVLYYVQSPSTTSLATSGDYRNNEPSLLSPPYQSRRRTNPNHAVARFLLSRYSSRGSTNTSLHEKRISYDLQSHETTVGTENGGSDTGTLLRICGVEEDSKDVGNDDHDRNELEEEEEDDDYGLEGKGKGCWRFFSFGTSPSCCWITLQITWRFLVSFSAALLVFFLATNPPPPAMSFKVVGVPQFGLGEGIDQSGVTTKILTCNCSMDLNVDNKSKLFGLHIRPSAIQMSFGPVVLATSQGSKVYVESHKSSTFNIYLGTKNKAMYGAGRSMQDMLDSRKGLPIIIRLRLKSNFKVVWNLINLKFHHSVECMLVLHNEHKMRHPEQAYTSSCRITSIS